MRIALPCVAIISVPAAVAQYQPVPAKGVTVRGNVNRPGVYPFPGHDTALTAIAEAAGTQSHFDGVAHPRDNAKE
jgi:protein involved in polysaccharide export with SLBB domain